MKRILITGISGTGKSTVAAALAAAFGRQGEHLTVQQRLLVLVLAHLLRQRFLTLLHLVQCFVVQYFLQLTKAQTTLLLSLGQLPLANLNNLER